MSYTNSEVAHRWVHARFGKFGRINGGSMYATPLSVYSYSTVIAQCLDREKQVFLVLDENLTPSTGGHLREVERAITADALVIRTHFPSYRYYHDVEFLQTWEEFDKQKRMSLLTHFAGVLYDKYEMLKVSRSMKDEKIDRQLVSVAESLNAIYRDCSLKNWLRNAKPGLRYKPMRKMVRLLIEGKSDAEITDALFGSGTWETYQKRIAPVKKAAKKREHIERLIRYLGYGYWTNRCPLSNKQLMNLSPRQVLDIKFGNIEKNKKDPRYPILVQGRYVYDKKNESFVRAMVFLGIHGTSCFGDIDAVIRQGVEIYRRSWLVSETFNKAELTFNRSDYQSFCAAKDKFAWRERFWKLSELKMRRLRGAELFYDVKRHPYKSLTEEETHMLNEYVARRNRQAEIEAKREAAAAAERRRKLHEGIERLERLHNCGIEGLRQIWREHLESISYEIMQSPEFCYGGNILLRLTKDGQSVETSKGIRMSLPDARRYFETIREWKQGGEFHPCAMAGYSVKSFDGEILVAGCHEIAYCEMERMYNVITA